MGFVDAASSGGDYGVVGRVHGGLIDALCSSRDFEDVAKLVVEKLVPVDGVKAVELICCDLSNGAGAEWSCCDLHVVAFPASGLEHPHGVGRVDQRHDCCAAGTPLLGRLASSFEGHFVCIGSVAAGALKCGVYCNKSDTMTVHGWLGFFRNKSVAVS